MKKLNRSLCLAICLNLTFLFASHANTSVSTSVFNALTDAYKHHENGQYNNALNRLSQLNIENISITEQGQILNLKGFIYLEQNKLTNALNAFHQSLKLGNFNQSTTLSTLQAIAQIYYLKENYSKTIETADKYLKIEPNKKPQIHVIKGQAYYQLKNYRQSVRSIQPALKQKKSLNLKIYENDLLILSAGYQELKQYKDQIITLKQLVSLYPKKPYYLALAGAYYENGETKNQLSVYESLYENNQLKASQQLINLAQLYIIENAPEKAAKLIEKAIDTKQLEKNQNNLKLLAHAWFAARSPEKAIQPLLHIAKSNKDGKIYMKLGHLFSQLERWDDAIDAFTQAKKHGNLPKKHNVDLLTGVACYHAGDHKQAKLAFKQSIQQKHYASTAKVWLNAIEQHEAAFRVN